MATTKKVTDTVEQAAAAGKEAFTQASDRAKAAFDQSVKAIDELNLIARDNVEAVLASTRAAAQGFEALTQKVVDFSRKSVEENSSAARTLASAKNPTEFFQLQNDFAKSQFDAFVAEASRMTETLVKVAGEVFEPISNRMAVAADKFAKAGAR